MDVLCSNEECIYKGIPHSHSTINGPGSMIPNGIIKELFTFNKNDNYGSSMWEVGETRREGIM